MNCPHCNEQLPEGLLVCFHCGEAVDGYGGAAESEVSDEQPEYRAEPSVSAEPLKPPRPVNEALGTKGDGGKKKGKAGIIAVALVFLLLGGAVGGHFMGFYALPFLPEEADKGQSLQIAENGAPGSMQPDEASGNGNNEQPVFRYNEPDEHGFIEAAFSYGLNGTTLSRIDSIMLFFDPNLEINLSVSDISDLRLFKDDVEIYVSISAVYHDRWDCGEPQNVAFIGLDPSPDEPGDYAATFTLFGKSYETISGSGSAIGQSSFGVPDLPPGDFSLRYSLPNIEIYADRNNPRRGTVNLKGFSLPDTITLGLWDSETQRGYTEAHFGVSFASNMDFVYEISSNHWEGFGWLSGEVKLDDLIVGTMEFDINNIRGDGYGHGGGHGLGNAWLTAPASLDSNFTWEFILPDNAEIDFDNLIYIGFAIRIYDELREERTFGLRGGVWELLADTTVSSYLMLYDYYNQ